MHLDSVPCACGCGFPIIRGMYAYRINGAYYAQGCVTVTVVPDEEAHRPAPSEKVTVIGSAAPGSQPMTQVPVSATA